MRLADALRMLVRRWYVIVAGVLLAAGAVVFVWSEVTPDYQRSASQLLLPGALSIPEGGNPYLYIDGLGQAADVLSLALGAESLIEEVTADHPGATVTVARDFSTAGPVVRIDVSGPTDAEAEEILTDMIERTAVVLDDIQAKADVIAEDRISVLPLNVDASSTIDQRNRITFAGGAGLLVLLLTLGMAGLVDGLARSRRRKRSRRESARAAAERALPDSFGQDTGEDDDLDVRDLVETPAAAGISSRPSERRTRATRDARRS
ncbi:hypothetical protein [Microbacterium oryzae]|nr:hypothetical protein [Microbacterium oryzae]